MHMNTVKIRCPEIIFVEKDIRTKLIERSEFLVATRSLAIRQGGPIIISLSRYMYKLTEFDLSRLAEYFNI